MGLRIDPSKRFERERQRAKQEEQAQQQKAREAIARKFAAQGLQGGGADIKVTRQIQEEGAKRLGGRLEDIAGREEQQLFQQQQIEDARKFARAEREATQKFGAEQSALAREQQAEQFAQQLGLSRDQFEAQKEQFGKQFGLQLSQFKFGKKMSLKQQELAEQAANLAMQQFDMQKKTEAFNAVQSIANQNGIRLGPEQVNAMIGILGPEIMGEFEGDFAELFGLDASRLENVAASSGQKVISKAGGTVSGGGSSVFSDPLGSLGDMFGG